MTGNIGKLTTNYCFVCKRKFLSVQAHWSRSKVHKRNTIEYHGQSPYERYKKLIPDNQKTLEEFLK